MAYTTLISTEALAGLVGQSDVVIFDARFTLEDESRGRREYDAAHIPGALYADLATDLSGPIIPGRTGRRPLPDIETFAATLSAWGIGPDTQVVAYDASGGLMAAARTWWMLRWAGHDKAAVLDGGWKAWVEEGRPVTDVVVPAQPARFVPHHRPHLEVKVDEVDRVRLDPTYALFDSRSEEGFHGGGVYHDPVRGHIPGARLANRADTLDATGHFRSAAELRAHFTALTGDVPAERTIFYCGSGVTAAQNLLAFAHAGLGEARHYVGSWSEWVLDPSRPAEL